MLKEFMNDETGVATVEFGLIATAVSVAAVTALLMAGGGVRGVFDTSSDALVVGVKAAKGASRPLTAGFTVADPA